MLVGNIASVLDTQNTPTNQYLKKIFLNKSKFHNSSPSINILRTGDETITQPDDTSGLRKTQLNFFNSNMNNIYQFPSSGSRFFVHQIQPRILIFFSVRIQIRGF